MSKFNDLYKLIFEALTADQMRRADASAALRDENLNFGPFKNERTYFTLPKVEDIEPSAEITNKLDQLGYYISSYRNGIAIKKPMQGSKPDLRPIKIGRLLTQVNDKELKKQFDERLINNIRNAEEKELSLCVTYNPYDIVGMSTGRKWTSCMDADKGAYKDTPFIEVQYGGMCIYLIDSNDKEVENPYARIAVKRLVDPISNKYFIFVQESIIYGDVALANQVKLAENTQKIFNKTNQYTAGNAIEFLRAPGEHLAYSDAGLSRILYIKDFETLDAALERGQQFSNEDWIEISKNPNLPEWFKEKYSDKLN